MTKAMSSKPRQFELLRVRREHAGEELGVVLTTGDLGEDQLGLHPCRGGQPLGALDALLMTQYAHKTVIELDRTDSISALTG